MSKPQQLPLTVRQLKKSHVARAAAKPEINNNVAAITLHVRHDDRAVGTPWEPLDKGALTLVSLFVCRCCGRAYTSKDVALNCSELVCIGGQL